MSREQGHVFRYYSLNESHRRTTVSADILNDYQTVWLLTNLKPISVKSTKRLVSIVSLRRIDFVLCTDLFSIVTFTFMVVWWSMIHSSLHFSIWRQSSDTIPQKEFLSESPLILDIDRVLTHQISNIFSTEKEQSLALPCIQPSNFYSSHGYVLII